MEGATEAELAGYKKNRAGGAGPAPRKPSLERTLSPAERYVDSSSCLEISNSNLS